MIFILHLQFGFMSVRAVARLAEFNMGEFALQQNARMREKWQRLVLMCTYGAHPRKTGHADVRSDKSDVRSAKTRLNPRLSTGNGD